MKNTIPTIFVDIDGTLIEFEENFPLALQGDPKGRHVTTLPSISFSERNGYITNGGGLSFKPYKSTKGSVEKIFDWHTKGYKIILTTGRPENTRSFTENQLLGLGFVYDMLIMGVGSGPRYLINDRDGNGDNKAFAINIDRNTGIGDIGI